MDAVTAPAPTRRTPDEEPTDPGTTSRLAAVANVPVAQLQRAVRSLGGLVDAAIDRVFDEPLQIENQAEALAVLSDRDDSTALRTALNGASDWAIARFARRAVLPRLGGRLARSAGTKAAGRIALPVTLSLEVGMAARGGVRELQVMASLLIARLRRAGLPVERDLVRRTTMALYLRPGRRPDLRQGGGQLGVAVARRWLMRAVPGLGRHRSRDVAARVRAVERLDLQRLVRSWREAATS
jgi:hypothetical protein